MIVPILYLWLWNTLLFIKLVQIEKIKFNETTLKKLSRTTCGFVANKFLKMRKYFSENILLQNKGIN